MAERETAKTDHRRPQWRRKGRRVDRMEAKVTTRRTAFGTTVGVVFIVHILVWFLLYPLAGYNRATVTLATGTFLFLGLVLVPIHRLGWRRIGLGLDRLREALLVLGAAHLVLLLLVLALRSLGMDLPALRSRYSLYALASNWILTGFGEELVFAGVLFNVVPFAHIGRGRWLAVLAVAAVFALWHLPGYAAVGLRTGGINVGIAWDLLLRMLSWCFFGAIYVVSGNLWLTAMAHGSTDYALLPAIIRSPVIGLVFMILLIVFGALVSRYRGSHTEGGDS